MSVIRTLILLCMVYFLLNLFAFEQYSTKQVAAKEVRSTSSQDALQVLKVVVSFSAVLESRQEEHLIPSKHKRSKVV